MSCKCISYKSDYQILIFPHMCGKYVKNLKKAPLTRLNASFEPLKKIAKSGKKHYL